jgi:hypothetical protein
MPKTNLVVLPREKAAEPEIEAGAPYPRIDEGTYIGICTGAQLQRAKSYGRYLVHLRFALPAEGIELPCFCNLGDRDNLKRRRARKGPASKFYKAWTVAAGRTPCKGEEMSLSVFPQRTFRVKVRTVSQDFEQDALAEALHYSVVDKILELIEASPTNRASTANTAKVGIAGKASPLSEQEALSPLALSLLGKRKAPESEGL